MTPKGPPRNPPSERHLRAATLHQLIAAASRYDAVTEQAFAWQRTLANLGIHGEIFAENIGPDMKGRVRMLNQFAPRQHAATLLRYSIWSGAVERALEIPPARLAVCYHNVTPAHFLEETNPVVAALCERGRTGLRLLAGRIGVAIADSEFNAGELHEAGIADVTVVPLLLDLASPPPSRPQVHPVVVTVGRVVPNKRIEEAIRAVALLRRHAIPDASLMIVGGSQGFELYEEALRRFSRAVGVDQAVTFTGTVSDTRLDDIYASAGAYICMSEHEGFCAPLIEAISRGLPVVARGAAAIPDTLGGAGIVIADGDPAAAAEALQAVLTDAPLRAELTRRAALRIRELAPDRVEPMIKSALAPVLA